MNHTVKIKIKSPLLRPGLELETQTSPRYVAQAMINLLQIVREVNDAEQNDQRRAMQQKIKDSLQRRRI
jgi:hypothetical protein